MDQVYADVVPRPPGWNIDWQAIEERFAWFKALEDCPQDPVFHGEGNVLRHTRMVCEALVAGEDWQALDEGDRSLLFWAALLHDVAKPVCTRTEPDGRIISPGHSRRGQIFARRLLWEFALEFPTRETLCHLITHHQVPFFGVDRPDIVRRVHLISYQTRCDFLAILAEADARGRICRDSERLIDNIELFRELSRDEACFDSPKAFANDHSRFQYFRKTARDPSYEAYDDTRSHVTMLCGLPAAGKDHWFSDYPGESSIVSLDDLRAEMGVSPDANQGRVISEAKERARIALRRGDPLIWNATNLSRQIRQPLIGLFADYNARVRIVYLETGFNEQSQRNSRRTAPVPSRIVDRMMQRWEPPDLTECHGLDVVLN